ncbi:MAG: hypothetical protein KGM97_08010 [Alphaproteobacteria bacterium]|nr:hypothetical protein [Alphaproteobacteria bacterium]MDE2630919.1 hypothetical protein [Alphaproteobacteria bacterium]
MTAIAAYPVVIAPAAKGRGGQIRGVEKAKLHRQFDGEYAPGQGARAFVPRQPAGCAACQFGTDNHASFWNGPRLRAAFVAQVLGQAMSGCGAREPSAQTAYRGPAVRLARILDQSL